MIYFYCTIDQYDKLKRALQSSGMKVDDTVDEEVARKRVEEWVKRLDEDIAIGESLWEQVNKNNSKCVE